MKSGFWLLKMSVNSWLQVRSNRPDWTVQRALGEPLATQCDEEVTMSYRLTVCNGTGKGVVHNERFLKSITLGVSHW